jgi:hypothetical protein
MILSINCITTINIHPLNPSKNRQILQNSLKFDKDTRHTRPPLQLLFVLAHPRSLKLKFLINKQSGNKDLDMSAIMN